MVTEIVARIKWKIIGIFLILLFILARASNRYIQLHITEKHWKIWCHDRAGLAATFLLGSVFLTVGLACIFFPQKVMRILHGNEGEYDVQSWTVMASGLVFLWPGIDIVSGLFKDWLTYCYP